MLTRCSRSCNITNFFPCKSETANVEVQDEMDPNESCGTKANLRENKVLDKWFSTVSINTLPVYENDTQNSPIKYYVLTPRICHEILRLTLWSLSGCNRQSNSKVHFFCRVNMKDGIFFCFEWCRDSENTRIS